MFIKRIKTISNCSEVTEEHFEEHTEIEHTHTIQQPIPPSMDRLLENFRDHLFSFILKCTEKNNLSSSVQQDIVDDLNFLLCFFKENYDSFISYHLDKNGFHISDCPELQQVLSTSDFFQKACDLIQSPFIIKEHCKSKMNMTEPISYTLWDNSVIIDMFQSHRY